MNKQEFLDNVEHTFLISFRLLDEDVEKDFVELYSDPTNHLHFFRYEEELPCCPNLRFSSWLNFYCEYKYKLQNNGTGPLSFININSVKEAVQCPCNNTAGDPELYKECEFYNKLSTVSIGLSNVINFKEFLERKGGKDE